MSKIKTTVQDIRMMEELAARDNCINALHPLVKLVLTVSYIAVVVSFPKYDFWGLAAMALYILILFNLAELSFAAALRRLRYVLPLVCMVGLANPLLDTSAVHVGGFVVRAGWVSLFTLLLKGTLAVLASYVLMATTGMQRICYALQLLHVPKVLVTQILLTYRYLVLLLVEVHRVTLAYALRAPRQQGVGIRAWGSLAGQLLLRSIDRAGDVYDSMLLRGYHGDFLYMGNAERIRTGDIAFLVLWLAVFALLRTVPVFVLIGNLML